MAVARQGFLRSASSIRPILSRSPRRLARVRSETRENSDTIPEKHENPFAQGSLVKMPCKFMRGGTSKGIFVLESKLPCPVGPQLDSVFAAALGSPDSFGRYAPVLEASQCLMHRQKSPTSSASIAMQEICGSTIIVIGIQQEGSGNK